MSARIAAIGNSVIQNANVLFGVALMENAYERTYRVEVLPAGAHSRGGAKATCGGKGRHGQAAAGYLRCVDCAGAGEKLQRRRHGSQYNGPLRQSKAAYGDRSPAHRHLDISEESHGNATGMGRADLAPRRFYEKISFDSTYPNFITSYSPSAFMMPIIVDSDEEVFKTAVSSCLDIDYDNPRIIMIRNSLEIEEILIRKPW